MKTRSIPLKVKLIFLFCFTLAFMALIFSAQHFRALATMEKELAAAIRNGNTIALNGVLLSQRTALDKALTNLVNTREVQSFIIDPGNAGAKKVVSGLFLSFKSLQGARMVIYDKHFSVILQEAADGVPKRPEVLPAAYQAIFRETASDFENRYYFRHNESNAAPFPVEYGGVAVLTDREDKVAGYAEVSLDPSTWLKPMVPLTDFALGLFDQDARVFCGTTDEGSFSGIAARIDPKTMQDGLISIRAGDSSFLADCMPIKGPAGDIQQWLWFVKDHTAQDSRKRTEQWIAATLITGLGLFSFFILSFFLRQILAQLGGEPDEIAGIVRAVAEKDLTIRFDPARKAVGVYAGTREMVESLGRIVAQLDEGVGTLSASSTELAAVSDQMSVASETTATKVSAVAAAAGEMTSNMHSVAASMEQASTNMAIIGTSSKEMSSSIAGIAANAVSAKSTTSSVVGLSHQALAEVHELGQAAGEIGVVTEIIKAISDKTNLLALNATIEAARAGEAGKGFAVVASEIKDLARQTTTATEDIAGKLKNIQKATGATVNRIEGMVSSIGKVDELVNSIAASVEEQNAATGNITENVTQAGRGIQEINENVTRCNNASSRVAHEITEVDAASREISRCSVQVQQSAGELSRLAEQLKTIVAQFRR